MEIFDVSIPIRDGMLHYAGNPPVHVTRVSLLEAGDPVNVSELDMGAHSGTHVDAPDHFLAAGAGAEALPLEALIGPADVVDATAAVTALDLLTVRDLELPSRGSERILFKTRNSQLWNRDEFSRDFVRLDGEAAAYLVERGVKLLASTTSRSEMPRRTACCSAPASSASRGLTCAVSSPAPTSWSAFHSSWLARTGASAGRSDP